MKHFFGLLLLITLVSQADAQSFSKRFVAPLEQRLTGIEAEWVAINPDTLLDLVLTGVATDGELKINIYQNVHSPSYFIKKTTQQTGMKSGSIKIADWNRDNKMDLLISGKTAINTDALFGFYGTGEFLFQKPSQKILDYSGRFVIATLDDDALPDILKFNDPVFAGITPTDIAVFDMNNDGANDIIISGRDQQNKPVTAMFIDNVRKNTATGVDGPISLADINLDGMFDVIVGGSIFLNEGDSLILDHTIDSNITAVFSGDMNSDGKVDLLLSGKRKNYIHRFVPTQTKLDTTGLIVQRIGDQDRDGDLDLIQVVDSIGSQWLKFFENTTTAKNKRPQQPTSSFAISTFDKTFIIWEAGNDDLTFPKSLTYDVWLGNPTQNVIPPSCDLLTVRRSLVRHGNAGTNLAVVVGGLPDDRYFYGIQSVDNAYNGSYDMGSGGGVMRCFDLTHDEVQACKGVQVKLAGGSDAVWYSMSRGLLGKINSDTLKFDAVESDTIFALVPQQLDCAKNKIFVINVNEVPPSEKQTIYACKGKTIKLEIAPGWNEISWNTNPAITNVSSIDYVVNEEATIIATAKSQGCAYKKEFMIKISQPSVTITGDGFQVLKGNSVQLEATGVNVETWRWNPPQGLSSSTIPNPVATPSISTEYVLTGTDSVGCTATATTHVFVQENAFVPNLFTPNGDGKNDNLMIYGLTSPSRFNFRIFSREGVVVYESKDVSQASSTGWNGFVSGTRQPSGIYYWSVDGEMPNGDKLLLNGKTTGSILLVH